MKRLLLRTSALLVIGLSLGPFLAILSTSLKSPQAVTRRPPTLLPDMSFENYVAAFQEHGLLTYVANSAIVAGVTTLIAVALGSLAAYALARLRLRRAPLLLGLVLLCSMFPQIAIVGGIYRLLRAAGLLNTHAGLVLPYTALTLPLAIWILTCFFREVPRSLEDAAMLDGCSRAGVLFRVILPVSAPAVFTTAILVFIYAWNEFFLALLITTNPRVQTLPVGIAKFPGEYMVPWGELAAAAVVATLPLVLLVLLLQRRIVAGITAGAVRG